MITTGFNHAYKESDFNKFFYGNDNPLIYHFNNGYTVMMNRVEDGYRAADGNVTYLLTENGMEIVESGGGEGHIYIGSLDITGVANGSKTYMTFDSSNIISKCMLILNNYPNIPPVSIHLRWRESSTSGSAAGTVLLWAPNFIKNNGSDQPLRFVVDNVINVQTGFEISSSGLTVRLNIA